MLLDNPKLTHWKVEENFEEMFRFERDYMKWITLQTEPQDSIGLLETFWNDFDKLTTQTRMIHNTKRLTQPWKSGLPVDFRPPESKGSFKPKNIYHRVRRALFGDYGMLGSYQTHPDPNQERLFFGLLKECYEKGIVTEAMIQHEMKHNHVRHDALDLLMRPDVPLGPRRKQPRATPAASPGKKPYELLMEQGILEIEALCYIRGRSIPNRFFILDEAQQLTPREAKTIVTRMSRDSKLVMVGDPAQIDNPYVDSRSNGLVYTRNRLKGQAFAAHIALNRGERSELAEAGAQLM